jgi:hypothetical protein
VELPTFIFTLVTGFLLFRLPRQWAPLPLLAGTIYMTLGQTVDVGPFHFSVLRILVALGAVRVLLKRERLSGGWHPLDKAMLAWAAWAVFSSCFHKDVSATLVSHLGLVYNALGIYFLLRIFVTGADGIWSVAKILLILLVPVALEMVSERLTGHNRFSMFGGVEEICEVRGGKIRAQGPFLHSILAGTVGAVCLPLAILFWNRNRKLCLGGIVATVLIVVSSSSSGPILTTGFVSIGLAFWKLRERMRLVRWTALIVILGLNMVMSVPVYYLLGRIDLTGNSTGFYRAALIESTFKHFGEWWVGGTDYTRHWMASGVPWSEDHADITNYYIRMGVDGGLPLMLLFINILVVAFRTVGAALRSSRGAPFEHRFMIWTLGAILFGHAATWMSVSYFDQSVVFLYFILAVISSVSTVPAEVPAESLAEPIGDPVLQ